MQTGFYPNLRQKRGDDDQLAACIDRVVNQLEATSTSGSNPGMLLGKIQSGKTRGFVGVIARAFDRGLDIALVLTKGTKTLSAQTVARLSTDFEDFIDQDELTVLDIMKMPGSLAGSELRRKIVIVAKKQARNLDRLISLIRDNPILQTRRILLIDDEADLASVRFVRKRGDAGITQGTIAEQMDELRRMVEKISFLQVTATPYSLYLQPEGYEAAGGPNYVFKPKRPAFTELLPIHGGYVGGNDYFGQFEDSDPRSFLVVEVADQEQDALRKHDRRRINEDNVLRSQNLGGLRRAIITFVLAACVRRWQQAEAGERKRKYSMVIHNDTKRSAHAWQDSVIDWILSAAVSEAKVNGSDLALLFDEAYEDISRSVAADHGLMPSKENILEAFLNAFRDGDIVREKVNSDQNVMALLDDKAELRLRTPFNIFVGGSILDRGITIPNLIAFYYGRNPKTMQADTVLQHSRMYGNRDRRDLAVTRFYTSLAVYDRLQTINEFEEALRGAFETGAHDQGVVFIQTDGAGRVRPCAPNKVLLSNVVAVSPNGMLLPTGFQTRTGRVMIEAQKSLEQLIKPEWRDGIGFVSVDRETAFEILDQIDATMDFQSVDFEWSAMKGLIDYYLDRNKSTHILLCAETGRNLHRDRSGDKSGRSILGPALRGLVLAPSRTDPALVLLRQNGGASLGWDSGPFWWPILAAPANAEPCVFASKTAA